MHGGKVIGRAESRVQPRLSNISSTRFYSFGLTHGRFKLRGIGFAWLGFSLIAGLVSTPAAPTPLILNQQTFHLRSGDQPEWDEFAASRPDGARLQLRFRSEPQAQESTLFVAQDNVKLDWVVELNGTKLGSLFLMEAPLVRAFGIPGGTLREGENTLLIKPPKENDDIRIGQIRLDPRPPQICLNEATLAIGVNDSSSKQSLPCRLTLVDSRGNLAALSGRDDRTLAARPGVVYTATGSARVGLPSGTYTIYATRGFEYGLATAPLTILTGEARSVQLEIGREVSTEGWASSDTHVHSFTYARHGDATLDERAITLAGEGITLPISTEHDQAIDFSEAARRMGVQTWFTPIVGSEVTTARGHFNIFPVSRFAALPDNLVTDWPQLMEIFRGTPAVQVVILNHPRNVHAGFQPFAATNFNAVTGENRAGPEFGFDAVEVANSSAMQSDWMISFRDWFALLNYGYRVTAVGSSDGHDVSRYIVGQGRTYIACSARNPAAIDLEEVCRNLKQGRALVSLGLLTQMKVNHRFTVGDIATNLPAELEISVTVSAPSWIGADRAELFVNGVRLESEKIEPRGDAVARDARALPEPVEIRWRMAKPAHDVYLVALATGPAVTAPYWALARPYQPSSTSWQPRVFGATNPIWVDGDSDGRFTPARVYAQRLWHEAAGDVNRLVASLAGYDQATCAQAASLCQDAGQDIRNPAFRQALAHATDETRRGFAAFAETVPAPVNIDPK